MANASSTASPSASQVSTAPKALRWLKTPTMLRPYAFDRVTVCGRIGDATQSQPLFSIVGTCYSEYSTGPSFFDIVDAAGALLGEGWYGLESCRPLGYRCEAGKAVAQ